MKNFFIKFRKGIMYFLKGIVIGIAMIVPGVSGGTLALMMNIYTDILDSVNGLFKHFGKSMKVLIPLLLGILVGFLALVIPIKYGLEKCPLVVITLFAGLIVGGIPALYRKVHGHEKSYGFALTALSIAFMIGICFLVNLINFNDIENTLLTSMNFGWFMYLFLAGIIIAMALVMPGISGSMMLMVMGLYSAILAIIKDNLFHFQNIGSSLLVILPLALGVIIGFFFISYIMKKLLSKHEVGTYFVIIGLVIGSLSTIYFLNAESIKLTCNTLQIVLAVVLFIIGFMISFLLDYYFNKKQKENISENNEVVPNDETR